MYYAKRFINILKSDKYFEPDVDTVFKKQYPPIFPDARFEIVGKTDEGNYVAFPIDGYRPKNNSSSNSSFLTSAVLIAASVAVGTSGNYDIARTGPDVYGSASKVVLGSSPQSSTVVDNAGPINYDCMEYFTNKTKKIEDAILFFNKTTIKPYAIRPYVVKEDMTRNKKHIYYSILNDSGGFSFIKMLHNTYKFTIEYVGLKNNTVYLRYVTYNNEIDTPTLNDLVELDLNKSNKIDKYGFYIVVDYADNTRIDLKFTSVPFK